MKKLLLILFMALAVPCMADWIEPYGVDCADDLFVGTVISTSGLMNVRDFWQNTPTADSDVLKNIATTGVIISTNALVGGTSTFADATYFTRTKYARTIGASFDNAFDSNTVTATIQFNGVDNRGTVRSETLTVVGSTVVYTSYPYQRITSAVLTVTSWFGTDRGVNGGGGTVGYGNLAKLYPRFGTGTAIGLTNIPAVNTVLQTAVDDTAKVESYATIDVLYGTVSFGDAPDGSKEFEVSYKARGAK